MKTIYASALLVDNKIKFWKISGHPKRTVGDFYKAFYYSGENMSNFIDKDNVTVEVTEFVETDDNSNEIFNVLAPKWFSQWEMIENYKGSSPFGIKDPSEFFVTVNHNEIHMTKIAVDNLIKTITKNLSVPDIVELIEAVQNVPLILANKLEYEIKDARYYLNPKEENK